MKNNKYTENQYFQVLANKHSLRLRYIIFDFLGIKHTRISFQIVLYLVEKAQIEQKKVLVRPSLAAHFGTL